MGRRPTALWTSVVFSGIWIHACGGSDRPEAASSCLEGECSVGPFVPSERLGAGSEEAPGTGGAGLIEEAPPAGAPAEGLGVEEALAGTPSIGVDGTIGVDGIQRVPPGLPRPGGAPALPGPDVVLSPPPGSAVDPVTGLEPPRTGSGVGPVFLVPIPEREPSEEDFTF